MEVIAPAKVNLYLDVFHEREDGYHEIETLFERISICDRIFLEPSLTATTIACDDPLIPTGEKSLMRQVIDAFNDEAGHSRNFKVFLEKHIPVSAGLGGGSSDAAALLKALNEAAGRPLDTDALFRISGRLGSDIPFFMSDTNFAFGRGRGDIIQKVETGLKIWHIIVAAPFQAGTEEMYGRVTPFGLTNNRGVDRIFTAFLNEENTEGIAKNLHNSLQEIALRDFPVLDQVFFELKKAGAKGVLLSGSGPTVFGIFEPEKVEAAKEYLQKVFLPGENWTILGASTFQDIA
ncbi:MAG: 4-(cytidine 5'-diphospho)-2-C-methyl-D-erythritol kinase [Candidatus Omnitrophica bacterium]|nr:4-(cytidine 5'-diphospho)-2-C-methyl-D-erythritol kinase [Candidatus Omnitrophota bacterium]